MGYGRYLFQTGYSEKLPDGHVASIYSVLVPIAEKGLGFRVSSKKMTKILCAMLGSLFMAVSSSNNCLQCQILEVEIA